MPEVAGANQQAAGTPIRSPRPPAPQQVYAMMAEQAAADFGGVKMLRAKAGTESYSASSILGNSAVGVGG